LTLTRSPKEERVCKETNGKRPTGKEETANWKIKDRQSHERGCRSGRKMVDSILAGKASKGFATGQARRELKLGGKGPNIKSNRQPVLGEGDDAEERMGARKRKAIRSSTLT